MSFELIDFIALDFRIEAYFRSKEEAACLLHIYLDDALQRLCIVKFEDGATTPSIDSLGTSSASTILISKLPHILIFEADPVGN